MATNNSYRLLPSEIVDKELLFRIPLYQRLFAWSQKEVAQLMNDLKEHYDNYEGTSKLYYIGMLTAIEQDGRLDLIDGQQRMTVLSLLAISFLLMIDDEANADTAKSWERLLLDKNGKPRLFFTGRSEDYTYLDAIAHKREFEYENRKMAEGVFTIKEFLKKEFSNNNELSKFANHIFNHLAIFITELPDNYAKNPSSLNEYFEAMNSSGKALEQHEILKVWLLKGQSNENKLKFTRLWNSVSNFEQPLIRLVEGRTDSAQNVGIERQNERYREFITSCRGGRIENVIEQVCEKLHQTDSVSIAEIGIEKKNPDETSRYEEDAIISFPKFLLFILALNNNDDKIAKVSPNRLLQTFKDNPPQNLDLFYNQLLYYRLLLDFYVVRKSNTSSGGSHTLIARNNDNNDKQAKASERVRQYQAMLNVSTAELHNWLFPLLKFLNSTNEQLSQLDILNYLKNLDKANGHEQCPPVEELNYEHRNGARYWFWKLDYILWERQLRETEDREAFKELGFDKNAIDKEAILNYEFRENRSIEHLHPQDQSHNELWDWSEINRFGNLAMISSSFNSTQSNWLVDSKLENLKPQIEQKNLQSLKLYFMYLQKEKSRKWTQGAEGSMQEHEKNIYKILKEYD